jgi:Domain of unknown function (DUF4252)
MSLLSLCRPRSRRRPGALTRSPSPNPSWAPARAPVWVLVWGMFGALGLGLSGGTASAVEPPPAPHPLSEAELEFVPESAASVIVNLAGPMLTLVSAATRDAEPAVSALVSRLEAVKVRLAPLAALPDAEAVRVGLRRISDRLSGEGWRTSIRSRDEDAEVSILQYEARGRVYGVTVLIFESDGEAGIIQLLGEIDPSQLAVLAEPLHVDALSRDFGTGEKTENR